MGNSPRYVGFLDPPYSVTLTDDSGAALNLAGCTGNSFTLTMLNQNTGLSRTCVGVWTTPADATGKASYQWTSGDMATAGPWWLYTSVKLPSEPNPREFDPELIAILPGTVGAGAAPPGVLPAPATGATVFNVKDYGALGDSSDQTAAILAAWTALKAAGAGTLFFPWGTYPTTGLLFQSASNFTLRADRGAILSLLGNTTAAPNQGSANVLTIADCTDFSIEGLAIDGKRDTLFPLTVLAANAAAAQPSIQVAHGAASAYVVGQRLNLCGGLTANGGNDANLQDNGLDGNGVVILSITPGAGAANDVITFTTNLAHAYTAAAGVLSDGYGPYAANGAYITPWQTGAATVAGRVIYQEDQQNGIHLINCKRFRISGCNIHNVWESPIRCGTHVLTGSAQNDGCSYGTITGNVLWHGYDQGVGLWCSSNNTVVDNVITAAGWAGICLTVADDNTIMGNISSDNVQRIPGDNTSSGHGVAIEGGVRNTISGNKLKSNYGNGVYLTAGGTHPFGGPGQVATTIAAGSNTNALPQGTINVTSTTGFAASGQFTVLASAGAQQITYTGKTGTTFTGCTGGVGKLYTGQRTVQYPVFLNNGAALAIASTTTIVSDGTLFQAGGHYSIIDGPKTERIDVLSIATNTLTLAKPTTFYHQDKCQVGQTVCEGNTISGNAIALSNDAGIKLASGVRTTIFGNDIDQAGLRGIDLQIWAAGGVQPPFGTVISSNTITAPNDRNDGAAYQAIAAMQCSDLEIVYNRCGGAPSTQGYFISIYLQAVTDSVLAGNMVCDAYAIGMELDNVNEWVCKRVQVSNNEILRCLGEGLLLHGGDALTISGNVISNSAANNGPGGFGGALDVRAVKNSQIIQNTVVNNGHSGIGLDDYTLQGVNTHCSNNIIAGNIVYDDGLNYDAYNGAHTQQGYGIQEFNNAQGPNTYLNNIVTGNQNNWNIQGTGNTLRGNQNYNPVGKFGAQPAVPASGVTYTNILNADATVYIAGGTVTAINVAGQATGMISGAFRVLCGQTIAITYSVQPSWLWFGD